MWCPPPRVSERDASCSCRDVGWVGLIENMLCFPRLALINRKEEASNNNIISLGMNVFLWRRNLETKKRFFSELRGEKQKVFSSFSCSRRLWGRVGSLVSFFPEVEGVGWLAGGGGLEEERGWKYLVQVARKAGRGTTC